MMIRALAILAVAISPAWLGLVVYVGKLTWIPWLGHRTADGEWVDGATTGIALLDYVITPFVILSPFAPAAAGFLVTAFGVAFAKGKSP
jgi:hypothetical protein